MRRAQVTTFVLLGLILLFLTLFLLFLVRSVRTTSVNYNQGAVEGYVRQCLNLVANDAFFRLGEQGGRLYQEQGGLQDPSLAVRVAAQSANGEPTQAFTQVGYGLVREGDWPFHPPRPSDYVAPEEDPYPFPGLSSTTLPGSSSTPFFSQLSDLYPLTDASPQRWWRDSSYDGALGQDVLPLPCKRGFQGCPHNLYPLPSQGASVQESLEAYLAKNLNTCIEEDELARRLGTTVEKGDITVNVTFTEDTTIITASVPLRFRGKSGGFQTSDVTHSFDVRLLKLFAFAHALLDRSSKDPFFRLNDSADYSLLPQYDDFVVTMERLERTTPQRHDLFLVTITDPKSIVQKSAYQFHFLLEDRPPILEPMSRTLTLVPILSLHAIDPDGDPLRAEAQLSSNPSSPTALEVCSPSDGTLACFTLASLTQGEYNISVVEQENPSLNDWQLVRVVLPSQ